VQFPLFFQAISADPARYPSLPFLILLSVIGGLLLSGLIVLFFLYVIPPKKKKPNFNIRVYAYYYGEHPHYVFFDKSDIAHTKTYDPQTFENQFLEADKYRVQNWINAIARNEDYSQFLEAEVRMNGKNYSPSMLELTGVDRDKNVIHFESHLIPYMVKSAVSGKKNKPAKPKKYEILSTLEEGERFVLEASGNRQIGIFVLVLFRIGMDGKKMDFLETDLEKKRLAEVEKGVRNVLYRFLSRETRYYKVSDTEYVLVARDAVSKAVVMNMASSLDTALQQYLNIHVPENDLRVAIGVTLGSLCARKLSRGIEQGEEMARTMENNASASHALLYDPNFKKRETIETENLSDIALLVANRTYRLFFAPTLNVRTAKQDFFFLKVIPYGTKLTSFDEVLEVAAKLPSGLITLYQSLYRKTVDVFERMRRTGTVFFEVPYGQLSSFCNAVSPDEEEAVSVLVGLRENELLAYRQDYGTIRKTLERLREAGYSFALVLNGPSTILPNALLRLFSRFVVMGAPFDPADPKVAMTLRSREANFALYSADLVYEGLKDYSQVELCAHYGGTVFQCDKLGALSSRPEEIDPETLDELLLDLEPVLPKGSRAQRALSDWMKERKPLLSGKGVLPGPRNKG